MVVGVLRSSVMELRLADPLIGLSAVGDLGRGLQPGHAARTCFVGCRLAHSLGVDDVVREVFFAALLQHIGCVAHAHDTAPLDSGRNIEVNAAVDRTDFSRPGDILTTFLTELTQGGDLFTRLRMMIPAARMAPVALRTSCEVGEETARRIGLDAGVQSAVRHVAEWYNGKGGFLHSRGEQIPLAARIVQVAFSVSLFDLLIGPEAAVDAARSRAGRIFDPAVADAVVREGGEILRELSTIDVIKELPGHEPDPKLRVDAPRMDEICLAFGEAVDLKMPGTHGSARRAFELADAAGNALGLPQDLVGQVRRAAALRDIGKAAVTSAVLEKPGPLTETEWEQVRLHAYHTERVLTRSPALAAEARLASLHHEREDGSGYHRGSAGSSLPMGARVIAATDALVAMTQPRPYRAAMDIGKACSRLTKDLRLHPDAVAAVTAAARGATGKLQLSLPAGLSERQIEVLRLVAQGLSNRQIAERLVVSPRTAEHHVQDVYAKIGRSSRAAAALFAIEHQLL